MGRGDQDRLRRDAAFLVDGLADCFHQRPADGDCVDADQRNAMFDSRFDAGVRDFMAKTPAERAEIVKSMVSGIDSFAARLAKLDPQTRAQWSAAVGPLLDRGVQRFAALDAPTQAQLMPVIRAFQKLR